MTILFEWLISNAITASLLALLAMVITKCFPRRPALSHACWLLVLIKLLTPPVYHVSLSAPQQVTSSNILKAPVLTESAIPPTSTPAPSADTSTALPAYWFEFDDTAMTQEDSALEMAYSDQLPAITEPLPVVATIDKTVEIQPIRENQTQYLGLTQWWNEHGERALFWTQIVVLAVSALLLILTMVRVIRFENLLQLATPAPDAIQQMARHMASLWGIKANPRVVMVSGKVGPLLWQRWQQPLIVLPRGLVEAMSESELKTVLAHELNHYRRGDHLWRYLELVAVTLYWWLPTVWWVSRRLRQSEEECCDAGVVATLPDGVTNYASALVRSLSFVTEPASPCPALSSGLGPVTLLKRRLHMLHANVERKVGIRGWFFLMAVAVVALPWGISWADDDDPPPLPRREARRPEARQDDRAERKDPVRVTRPADPAAAAIPPFAPGTPGLPTMPAPVQAPARAGVAHAAPAAPSMPGFPGQGGFGMNEDMRAGLETAVKQAELDLKVRRIKVKQTENAVRQREADLEHARRMQEKGTISSTEVREKQNQLDNAKIELELALVEVERGELSLEVARQRSRTLSRQPQPFGGPFGGVTAPVPPGREIPSSDDMPPTPRGRGIGGAAGGLGGSLPPAPGGAIAGGLRGFGSLGSRGSGSPDAFFRNFDRHNTGKIRREDVPDWMRERFFEVTDTNKDGIVDQEEFSANYNKLWEQGNRTGGPGGGRVTARNNISDGAGRRGADRDPRDDRIEQLERELREMRKALENMKKPDGTR
ncbi:MAG: M48 family metalloprotease [Planctomycetia bacterium]|nr:M48 family metalloprotease [Planctomycetia bacterium]